mgnify:CR=1 FL=1
MGLREAEARALALTTSGAARQAAPRLADFVAARLTVVESLARERAQHEDMQDAEFSRRAEILQASFGGLLAINWIDTSGLIRLVVPEGPNKQAVGRNVRQHPVAAPFFLAAERSGKPVMTSSLVLFQGQRGVASYFPVHRNGRVLGYVNGVFDCEQFIRSSLREGVLDRYLVRVSDESGVLFESAGFGAASGPRSQADAQVAAQRWRVQVEPNAALASASHSQAVNLLLLLAAVLCPAVWALSRVWLERRRAVAQLAEERRRLEVQMVESQKLEAIGRLAGGVAHDFNNLLTAMIGHAELARRSEGVAESVKEDLGVIIDAAQRGAEITRDLLTFSRKEVVRPRAIDAAQEVLRLLPMLEHLLREDVQLSAKVDPDAGCVLMDPSQLERALMNLIVNAVDAQPNGGRIQLSGGRGGGGTIRNALEDQGEGMTGEIAPQGLEPFFTTKEAGKGTGLGLASVYGMTRQVGGDVTLTTALGVGTTIALHLPRVDPAAEAASEGEPIPVSARQQRVLLVEDDASVRNLTERVLAKANFVVSTAANADEALALVEAGTVPDVLLTDEVMPGLRGHALAEKLRARLPHLRVLVCSGHAEDLIDAQHLESLGAGFLQKPYTPTRLLDALAKLSSATD